MPLFARPGSTGPDASEPTGLRLFGAAATTVVRPPFADHTVRQFAGHAKDDPDFDQYLEEIRRFREQSDQQQCSNSSSTPTT